MNGRDLLIYAALLLIGAIGGYVVGRAERQLGTGKTLRQRLILLARVLTGLLLLAGIVFFGVKQAQRAECYSDYFIAVSGSLKERSDATGQDLASERALWQAVVDTEALDLDVARARIAAIDELQAARAAAPIPTPPRCR